MILLRSHTEAIDRDFHLLVNRHILPRKYFLNVLLPTYKKVTMCYSKPYTFLVIPESSSRLLVIFNHYQCSLINFLSYYYNDVTYVLDYITHFMIGRFVFILLISLLIIYHIFLIHRKNRILK